VKYLPPIIVVLLAVGYTGYRLVERPMDQRYNLNDFASLPVVHGGRVKPMDSLAGHVMLAISDRRYYLDADGERQPAVRFLLDAMSQIMGNDDARQARVFRIDNTDVRDALGLPERKRFRYALSEFVEKLPEFEAQVTAAVDVDAQQRSLFQRKAIELSNQLHLYSQIVQWQEPLAVPPSDGSDNWRNLFSVAHGRGTADPASEALGQMLMAWHKDDPATFNRELAAYQVDVKQWVSDAVRSAAIEHRVNDVRPFVLANVFYIVAFLLVAFGWLVQRSPSVEGSEMPIERGGFSSALLTSAAWLTLFTLLIHTVALGVRMYLQGRPPVTNLYSSAVFIGWGAVVAAMILEWLFRNGIGTLTAAALGFATLVVAINLETRADGETLEMMQAVLDTNFWLATHVTTVTIGYSATFMAGFLGILFIVRGLFTRSLTPDDAKTITRMIYGVVCFALLFSFVGTVLGGIWADQSWGRFWGWDPKENGALIIVIWNALILHARWGGMIRQRGMAVLAVAGNIVTAWSWFGTNLLGVGLHSYGFIESGVFWMLVFVSSQLAVIALGLLPVRAWRSPLVPRKVGPAR